MMMMMMMKQQYRIYEKRKFQLKRQNSNQDSDRSWELKKKQLISFKVGQFNRFAWIRLSFIGIDDEQKAFMNRPKVHNISIFIYKLRDKNVNDTDIRN